jgi:hypothetical protein
MLKTVEALFVVVLVFTTLYSVQNYIQLPSPRLASSIGLQEFATSTLKSIDSDGALTQAAFSKGSEWPTEILKSIDSNLPPNTIYKLTAYQIDFNLTTGKLQYISNKTGPGDIGDFPSGSITTSYTVTSPDVTVTQTPEKIKSKGSYLTLYILNCDDANGWWITGFTGQTLANDVYEKMSPYFETTIMVNSTAQLETLLSGSPITNNPKERVQDAVVINTFGESIPIPSSQAASYEKYPYSVGKRVNQSNWTWVSIVGYPFYYASNKVSFASYNNSWGIYGMRLIESQGLNYFLQGIDYTSHATAVKNTTWITKEIPGVVYYTDLVRESQDYYGLYTGTSQTSTRALPKSDLSHYHLSLPLDSKGRAYTNIFKNVTIGGTQYYAGATWAHRVGGITRGSFMAIGLARTPDIRVALIGLLGFYQPKLLRTEFSVTGTTRVVELQVGQLGAS